MKRKALKAAFPHTLPILTGFTFLGLAYGIYMRVSGFSFIYPLLMGFVIFGGSLQFVCTEMLLSPFAPLQVFIMALLIHARHLFYGLSMLDKYKNTGWKKYYMIYGLADETFSINCSADIPEDVDKGWFMFFVTLLHQIYWVTASVIGSFLGSLIHFDTDGISFVMTSMFVVIYMNQWEKEKNHFSSLIGIVVPVICLVIFGADSFMIPTMISILVLLTIFKKPIERREEADA